MDKLNIKSFEGLYKSLPEINLKVKASIPGISGLREAVELLSSSVAILGKMFSSVNFSAINGEITSLNASISMLCSTLDNMPAKQNAVNDSANSYAYVLSKTGEIIIKSLLGPVANLTDRIDNTGKTTNMLTDIFKDLLSAIYDIATGLSVIYTLSPSAFNKIVQYGVLVGTTFRSLLPIIGIVSAAIVTLGLTVMGVINAVRSIPLLVNSIKRNFAGESIIDIGLDNIKEMSFGVLDFTRKSNSAVKDKPLNGMGDRLELDRELNEELQTEKDKRAAWENGFKKLSTDNSGITSSITQNIQGYKEELNLVKLQNEELDELKLKLEANTGNLGAEKDIRMQILDVEREIFRLQTGIDFKINSVHVPKTSEAISKVLENMPGITRRSGPPRANELTPRERRQEEFEHEKELLQLEEQKMEYAQGMWSNFQGMLEATGLMKGQFGEIISFINSFINGISSGVSFVDSLVGFFSSFIPGGSVIAGAASGGGAMSGMQYPGSSGSYNTGQMLNSARGNTTSNVSMQPINISGELRLRGKDAVYVYDRNKAIQQSLIN